MLRLLHGSDLPAVSDKNQSIWHGNQRKEHPQTKVKHESHFLLESERKKIFTVKFILPFFAQSESGKGN